MSASEAAIDLSIVIVSWNSAADLQQCLSSLYVQLDKRLHYEVIVADNASTDGTVAEVKRDFPLVRLIEGDSNVGYSIANNRAIKAARGQYVLLLNPDTIFIEDCVSPLIKTATTNLRLGLIACRLLNFDHTSQKSVDLFPFPFQEVNPVFRAKRRALLRKVQLADATKSSCRAGVIIGAFQLMRRQTLLDAGMLDERLFMYGEDLDLCYRIEKMNLDIVYDASVSIVHVGGKSSDQVWSDTERLRKVRQSIFMVQCKHFGLSIAAVSLLIRTMIGFIRLYASALLPGHRPDCQAFAAEASANSSTLKQLPDLIKNRGAGRYD